MGVWATGRKDLTPYPQTNNMAFESKKFPMNQIFREKKGFTLIEMAFVLIIVGLLLGLGANMIGPLTKRAKTIETNDIVNAAVDSIIGYTLVNKKLPQWTDGNDAVIATNEFHYSLRNYKDAWGNPLFYAYDNNLFTTTNICSITTTNLTVRKCNDSACTAFTDTSNVAFIVYSRGENVNYQTIQPGPVAALPAYIYDRDVSMNNDRVSGNILIPNNIYPPNVNDPVDNGCAAGEARCQYDDIVKWVTLLELQTKASCSGCVGYEVYNAPLAATNDFRNNLTGACYTPLANTFITSISRGGSIERHTTNNTTCAVLSSAITYNNAAAADVNRNCQVNYPNALPLTDR